MGAVTCEALLGLEVKNLFWGWKNSAEVIILLLLVFIFKLNAVNLLLAKMIWAYTIHNSFFAHIIFRYIVIPSNRGKDTKQKGKALIGTGGSGEAWLPLATLCSQTQVEKYS